MFLFGLIGKKLGHSYSALFFNDKFKKEGIDAAYRLFPLPSISDFPGLLTEYPGIAGLNVTVPYKEEVIPFLTRLSPEALEVGAVNVIKFLKNGSETELIGYNSDVYGFRESLRPLLKQDIKKALILGTGGASKAVAYVLKNLGISVSFVSRNPGKDRLTYSDLNEETIKENLLIVNTTPLGMFPNISESPDIPYRYISPSHICYDLVYNPEETEFLKKCRAAGAITKNGLEMLRLQALKAWEIWNNP